MSRRPLIIGHRGASAHAPENTIAALKMAVDAGADGVEFDVRLAKDGVPVVIHDADLWRVARRRDKVADLYSGELAQIDVGTWFDRMVPERSLAAHSAETVPTLEQVLQTLNNSAGLIYVELKTDASTSDRLVDTACDVIRNFSPLFRIIVKSFDLDALRRLRTRLPDVAIAALFDPSAATVLRRRSALVAMAAACGAGHVSVHWSMATRRLVAAANAAEMPVTVWTVEHPRWIARANEIGIRSLITNDPSKLLTIRDRANLQ